MMLRALPRAAAGIAASLALQQTCQQSDDRLARWRKRWEGDTRGWELGKTVHPRLAEFEERLLPEPSRVLVPLAGQSHDVAHLAWRGHSVVAVEGVPAALDAFKEAYGADEARRIAGHACDDYDGDDVRGALATMHVVRLPFEGGSKRLTWHTGDFLGNFSCPIVWKSTGTATPSSRRRVDRMRSKTPGRTLVDVHLAVVRRVEDLERALEALRLEQELEVRLAARPQEGHHGFVRLDGLDDFGLRQRPAAVDVDEVEALAGRVQKLVAEFFDLLGRPRGLELALGRAVRELVLEGVLDRGLPARNADR